MSPYARLRLLLAVVAAVVAACGGNADGNPEPVRSYTLHLRTDDSESEYMYVAEDPIDLRVGDEVTFELRNPGTLIHDLQIVDPAGDDIATAPSADPGRTTSVTVMFEEAGFYRLNCLIDDHLTAHGMQAIVEVTEP